MSEQDAQSQYLNRLREWRNRPDKDVSLEFLEEQFKREVEKPYKQLHAMAVIWDELVPEAMAEHVWLESLSRGVLRVAVDSSAALYELDRLLREGLEQELIRRHKGPAFRSVKLRIRKPNRQDGRRTRKEDR